MQSGVPQEEPIPWQTLAELLILRAQSEEARAHPVIPPCNDESPKTGKGGLQGVCK